MLYLVFGRIFDLGAISRFYPLSLLIGIVLFTFFSEATSLGMTSIIERGPLLGRLAFPRLVIPTSRTLGVALTFGINLTVIAAFVAWNQIVPRWNWVLLIPLFVELYIFVLGLTLVLASLFVRFRDIAQVWELATTLLFYATPILYPVGYLPPTARTIVFLNPLTQVLQDARALILYDDLAPNRITAAEVFSGLGGRGLPIAITFATLALGLAVFRRESPWFAERL
jgi:ABC-2 type transport system permease protein